MIIAEGRARERDVDTVVRDLHEVVRATHGLRELDEPDCDAPVWVARARVCLLFHDDLGFQRRLNGGLGWAGRHDHQDRKNNQQGSDERTPPPLENP